MNKPTGFTLLETFIVVIVLAFFASIVMPQFSKAASEARISGLCDSLQKMRTAINLYKAQHNDRTPCSGSDCNFTKALTIITDPNGNEIYELADNTISYGPYLRSIPRNPYNNLNTVDTDGQLGDDSHGWHYDSKTGRLAADDSIEHSEL